MAEKFTNLTLDEFLDRVAKRAPVPGGGAVAAAAGALSCALARMVAEYSLTRTLGDADRVAVETAITRLGITDELMRALIAQDAEAYQRLAAAAQDRRSGPSERTEAAYQEALAAGVAVPLQIVGLAAQALSVLCEMSPLANRFLLSDLGAAAVLAEASAHAAGYMVRVNARELADPPHRQRVLSDLDAMLGRCRSRAASLRSRAESGS